MDSSIVKKILPHGIALVAFIAISFLFFSPYVFDGKVLKQGDNDRAGGMNAEAAKYAAKGDPYTLWTNGAFGGMPTAQMSQQSYGNLLRPVFYIMLLKQAVTAPHASLFLAMLCMYILLLTMRVDWRLGIIGALGFGLSSFNMDIIEAGHSTKMVALAFAPLVLAGSVLAFRKQYVLGGVIFGLALGLQLYASHVQITYYTLIILLIGGITELVSAIKHKTLGDFTKSALVQIVALLLALGSNATALWTTQEYATETIRGKSELASTNRPKEGGLDKKYASGWSYGVGESLTLLVQNAYGGGASQTHEGTETYDRLKGQILQSMVSQNVPTDKALKQVNQQVSGLFYTGEQPFVGVSIYWGAIFIFLFMTGLYLIEDRRKWWLSISSLVMLMTAWGHNFFFFDIMFEYFPFFNKFRSVSQALGLGQLLLIALSMFSLQAIFDPSVSKEKKQRGLMIGAGVTTLLCFMAMGVSVVGKNDAQLQPELVQMLQDDRSALIRADVFRSLLLVFGAASLIWLYLNNRLKATYAVIGIGILTLGDSWTIGKRIIYNEKFETPAEAKADLQPNAADKKIMLDPDPHYRVLELTGGNPFQNARASNFHKSIGGYHAAKLMRFQEVVDTYLGKFEKDIPILQQKMMPLYGMLNVKYIMMGEEEKDIQQNPFALGNAWFVKNIQLADNADKELAMIGSINPRYDVVIQKSNMAILNNFTPQYDSTATIKLTSYHPDKLEYQSSTKSDQLAVFSEIYYPMEKGWNMTIDGQPTVFVKANYIVRAAKIPAGNHKIVMWYAPKSYFAGETISYIASGGLILAFLAGLFLYFKKQSIPDVDLLPEEEVVAIKEVKPKVAPKSKK
jgi:Bacterial membrane protein YfhO